MEYIKRIDLWTVVDRDPSKKVIGSRCVDVNKQDGQNPLQVEVGGKGIEDDQS